MEDKLVEVFCSVFNYERKDFDKKISMDNIDWDSLAHFRLILAIESAFNIEFEESEIEDMTSFEIILAKLLKNNYE